MCYDWFIMNSEDIITGRVVEEHKARFVVRVGEVEYSAVLRGKVYFADEISEDSSEGVPKVGDFVECSLLSEREVVIERILPRTSVISRKASGSDEVQVIVTNVNLIFIVMGLDEDFNIHRLERYLLLANQSGITPVVVLNKADLVEDSASYVAKVEALASGLVVHAVSAIGGSDIDVLRPYVTPDTTAVLLGSSGAGKSTITNVFLDSQHQSTQGLRDDGRGKHTTTHRQLFQLSGGGFLIDTPGMRELGIAGEEEVDSEVFAHIQSLMSECKYTRCDHEKTEGCAVQKALADGRLDTRQYEHYLKLETEREKKIQVSSVESHAKKRRISRKANKQEKKSQKQGWDHEY